MPAPPSNSTPPQQNGKQNGERTGMGVGALFRRMVQVPGLAMIFGVRMYQVCISPLLGSNCRYTPTCSAYFIEAVRKYGAIVGGCKGVWRICRCHPFCRGGHDPP